MLVRHLALLSYVVSAAALVTLPRLSAHCLKVAKLVAVDALDSRTLRLSVAKFATVAACLTLVFVRVVFELVSRQVADVAEVLCSYARRAELAKGNYIAVKLNYKHTNLAFDILKAVLDVAGKQVISALVSYAEGQLLIVY